MTITDGIYVWRSHPGDTHGLTPVVRAANGQGHTANDGYDFRANYRAWAQHYSAHLPAWTYFYPGDSGVAVAEALLAAAPGAPFYVVDIEDKGCGSTEIADCVNLLKRHGEAWLSTWGLTKQCVENKVNLSAAHWNVITPQKYYAYQDTLGTNFLPHCDRLVPSISPADYSGWRNIAKRGQVLVWEYANYDVAKLAAELKALPGRTDTAPGQA